jgi:hypothetical protein
MQWIRRIGHSLDADPGGCWLAEDAGRIVGFAISQNRDDVWFLATYGVRNECQGRGVGKRLLDGVLAHAGERGGLFSSTTHPGATRRYRLAGFLLHPQMRMVGTVDRSTLPSLRGLHVGSLDDFEWMNRLDTTIRGGGHGPDHHFMLGTMHLIVSSARRKPGYVYIDEQGRPALVFDFSVAVGFGEFGLACAQCAHQLRGPR